MRLPGIQTVVVYAIVGESLRASLRNTSSAYDTEQLIEDIFGAGMGGTKQGIGGAKVPLGLLSAIALGECDCQDSLWKNIKSVIEHKFTKSTSK